MLSMDRRQKYKDINQQYDKNFVSLPFSQRPVGKQETFPPRGTPASRIPPMEKVEASTRVFTGRARPGREPLMIIGERRGRLQVPCAAMTRPTVVYVAVSVLLLFIMVGALIAVMPVGTDAKEMNPFLPIIHLISSKSNGTALIAAQEATATAVTVDGYDPGGHQTYAGVQSAPSSLPDSFSASDAGNLSRFFYGQCTYWSNMRYRQLTGHWIPWLGDAYQWAYAAPSYGWVISEQPNPHGPSIIVLAPYAQGSGHFGHVAVVENAVPSASHGVITSNWNWNGRWAVHDWVRFYPGPGVSFLWYPGP